MNILLMPTAQMLAMIEGAGGLFDFNATLPLMAIQFMLLSVVLTFLFYKPVSKVIDDREKYINDNLRTASQKLIEADELYSQYEEFLQTARNSATRFLDQAKKEATDVVNAELKEARKDAENLVKKRDKELEDLKTLTIEKIEYQVGDLSRLIKRKILGDELMKY
jgi:F-type H+-transporting ATPase subunit b